MFPSASGVVINGGTWLNASTINLNQSKRGLDFITEQWVADDALHNSDEPCDAPKCHPHTRVAVLDDIMKWVIESEAKEDFILWLFGPAGAGKTAIAKRIAEIAADKGLLIGSFFFSRTSSTRNSKDRLIPTLAYQMALSIPDTRTHIEEAIERDPIICKKNIETQIDTLLIQPFQSASTQTIPSPKLVIIDGLDECNNSQNQVAILDAISRSFPKHKLPMIFLVVSRPEVNLSASFNSNEPLKFIHRRLALDDNYRPDNDIRLFFSDRFEHIRRTHRLKSTIPNPWPTDTSLEALVKKSSGQFIFAATVVKFIESNRHRPTARLDVILGISPPGSMNPFTELDALYQEILSSMDDIKLTLRVLSLYTAAPKFTPYLGQPFSMSTELFLSLEEGDIDLALINLSSIVSYDESSGEVQILHASLVDFLSDKRRSNEFYIDMASTRTDFACRTLQYVKGPDGIRAGDFNLFRSGVAFTGWILNSQLKSDILNFDLDAFITAMIKNLYKEGKHYFLGSDVIFAFITWMNILDKADNQLEEALFQCLNSFESRLQKYQSDWRLQLLLTLATVRDASSYPIPNCRGLDILLEMDNHELHLVDQHALDLRHYNGFFHDRVHCQMINIIPRYVDGDRYASAALHCMRFLSNPLKCPGNDDISETGLLYLEWQATCGMVLNMLRHLLPQANTSPELVEFMSNHDIDSAVRQDFSVIRVWEVDTHILAFLSRACVCINWRIISAIRQASATIDEPPSEYETRDSESDEEEDGMMILERMDQCCNRRYHSIPKDRKRPKGN